MASSLGDLLHKYLDKEKLPMLHEITVKLDVPENLRLQVFQMILEQGAVPDRMNRVDLIRLVRTGLQEKYPDMRVGLKEAKDYVDEIVRRIKNWNSPPIYR